MSYPTSNYWKAHHLFILLCIFSCTMLESWDVPMRSVSAVIQDNVHLVILCLPMILHHINGTWQTSHTWRHSLVTSYIRRPVVKAFVKKYPTWYKLRYFNGILPFESKNMSDNRSSINFLDLRFAALEPFKNVSDTSHLYHDTCRILHSYTHNVVHSIPYVDLYQPGISRLSPLRRPRSILLTNRHHQWHDNHCIRDRWSLEFYRPIFLLFEWVLTGVGISFVAPAFYAER